MFFDLFENGTKAKQYYVRRCNARTPCNHWQKCYIPQTTWILNFKNAHVFLGQKIVYLEEPLCDQEQQHCIAWHDPMNNAIELRYLKWCSLIFLWFIVYMRTIHTKNEQVDFYQQRSKKPGRSLIFLSIMYIHNCIQVNH